MGNALMAAAATTEAADITSVGTLITTGVEQAFTIATKAFDFLMANPLCALMVGVGFAYTALSLIKRGIRVAKRS